MNVEQFITDIVLELDTSILDSGNPREQAELIAASVVDTIRKFEWAVVQIKCPYSHELTYCVTCGWDQV